MCAKYAFMPNKLQYCGGDQNAALFELTVTNDSHSSLNNALREFETLYPYLKLIAQANKIKDPFDYRVVEAYWLGNDLLKNVQMKGLYNHFVDHLHLKKKLTPRQFELTVGKIPAGALPHHSFHVFNVWLRTGKVAVEHTVETMDQCRISWGKIKSVGDHELEVESPRLIITDNVGTAHGAVRPKIKFSPPQTKKIIHKMLDESFIKNPQVGDWISFHWGWACDKLTEQQVKNLEKYTFHNLNIANCK